jgi:hypothetical protein
MPSGQLDRNNDKQCYFLKQSHHRGASFASIQTEKLYNFIVPAGCFALPS